MVPVAAGAGRRCGGCCAGSCTVALGVWWFCGSSHLGGRGAARGAKRNGRRAAGAADGQSRCDLVALCGDIHLWAVPCGWAGSRQGGSGRLWLVAPRGVAAAGRSVAAGILGAGRDGGAVGPWGRLGAGLGPGRDDGCGRTLAGAGVLCRHGAFGDVPCRSWLAPGLAVTWDAGCGCGGFTAWSGGTSTSAGGGQ